MEKQDENLKKKKKIIYVIKLNITQIKIKCIAMD